jgi:hypothetical protein
MRIAFVLGNGKSRLAVDLDQLKNHGRVYGCNALYREFAPDVLVATDPEISKVIQESGYALENVFYTRVPLPNLGARSLDRHHYGYSSGPNALAIALKDGMERIFMLGFDLDSADDKFNNVYADTEFYKKSTQEPTYYHNWVKQIAEITDQQKCHIFRINDHHVFPEKWQNNIKQRSMQEFLFAIDNNKLEAL